MIFRIFPIIFRRLTVRQSFFKYCPKGPLLSEDTEGCRRLAKVIRNFSSDINNFNFFFQLFRRSCPVIYNSSWFTLTEAGNVNIEFENSHLLSLFQEALGNEIDINLLLGIVFFKRKSGKTRRKKVLFPLTSFRRLPLGKKERLIAG